MVNNVLVFNGDSKKEEQMLKEKATGVLERGREERGKDQGRDTGAEMTRVIYRRLCTVGSVASCLSSSLEWDEV